MARTVQMLLTAQGPRSYVLHVPAGHDGRTALPLVLFLHGAGGTADWALDETGWTDLADREGFVVLAPNGTRADPHRPAGFLNNPQVWNDGSPFGQVGHVASDDVGFIAALLDLVQQQVSIHPRRLFVTGFSNGAALTFRLATELSERFAALAPVCGVCWLVQPRPALARSTLYLVGADDPLIPLDGGEVIALWGEGPLVKPPVWETIQTWAAALGCPATPAALEERDDVQVRIYRPGHQGAELHVWIIGRHGHHWPGGRGQLSRRLFGPPNRSVRGNEVIWRFFKEIGDRR